jgi:hypothetical protein
LVHPIAACTEVAVSAASARALGERYAASVKRGLMLAVFLALLAGAGGNVVERYTFGPTKIEKERAAAIVAAERTGDTATAERLLAAGAVDVAPREMAFTMLPFVGVLAGYVAYVVIVRRPRGQPPEPSQASQPPQTT